MISYYIIPNNVNYVQFVDQIETWEKINKPVYNIPVVAVIEDSKATHYTRFVVIYKGMMQQQGGSGSCYNPTIPTYIHRLNPMDNSTMPQHMSKWTTYSYTELLRMVVSAKYSLLDKMGYRDMLPFWYWDCENFHDLIGILIAKLDLIGLGKLDPKEIKKVKVNKILLLN